MKGKQLRTSNLRDVDGVKPSMTAQDSAHLDNVTAQESYATGKNVRKQHQASSSGVVGPFGARGKK